jgi:hypothetical protein
MHVTGKPIKLRDDDRALVLARRLEGGRQLRPTIEGIRALAGFDFLESLDQR